MTHYSFKVRIGTVFSQFLHVLIGGHPDVSISTAAHLKRASDPRWERIAKIAERMFGPGHCAESFEADRQFGRDILEAKPYTKV